MKVSRLITIFIAANTRQPATASSVFEVVTYFEMVFLEILPSAYKVDLNTCVCDRPSETILVHI